MLWGYWSCWGITRLKGCLFGRGLEDLYGLVLFLQATPWCHKTCWTRALLRPYLCGSSAAKARAHACVAALFWRTQKADVMNEISLPAQTEETLTLRFTPVEAHFYRRQHEECKQAVNAVLQDLRRKKQTTLDDRAYVRVLQQVLKLRQACCHPQVGGAGVQSIHKSVLTMDEILKQLRQRAKVESEEGQRLLVAAENGLAGLALLQNNPVVAMEHYRNVLLLAHKGDYIRVDALPHLHAVHNLASVMREQEEEEVEVGGKQLSVSELAAQEEKIRRDYSAAHDTNVNVCAERLKQASDEVSRALVPNTTWGWYIEALNLLGHRDGGGRELLDKVENVLSESDKYSNTKKRRRQQDEHTMVGKFRDVAGLKFLLQARVEMLYQKRQQLLMHLTQLCKPPTQSDVHECGNCGDCKANFLKTGARCKCCQIADHMDAYKCALFHHNAERAHKQTARKDGGQSAMWWEQQLGNNGEASARALENIGLDGTSERTKYISPHVCTMCMSPQPQHTYFSSTHQVYVSSCLLHMIAHLSSCLLHACLLHVLPHLFSSLPVSVPWWSSRGCPLRAQVGRG
jgi:E3 ubiquitin-protein ligase SHPRH